MESDSIDSRPGSPVEPPDRSDERSTAASPLLGTHSDSIRIRIRYPMGAVVVLLLVVTFNSFAFFSLKAILNSYLSASLRLSNQTVSAIIPSFDVLVYSMAPVAGLLADQKAGNYHTQLWSYWLWSLGAVVHFCTTLTPLLNWIYTFSDSSRSIVLAMFGCVALGMQALGYGLVRAIQTVLIADQFDPRLQVTAQSNSFPLFYFFLTLGSLVGQIFGPVMQNKSLEVETGAVAAIIVAGTFALLFPRKRLVRKQPRHLLLARRRASVNSTEEAGEAVPPPGFFSQLWADVKESRHVLAVFAFMPVYYCCFYQLNTTWVFQAGQLNRTLFGNTILPQDQIPTIQSLFTLLQLPVFVFGIYRCSRHFSVEPTLLRRLGFGFVCTFASFLLFAALQFEMEKRPPNSLSVWWQVPQLWLLASSEITVVISGLELAYKQTPPRRRNLFTAVFMLTGALGILVSYGANALVQYFDPKHRSWAYFTYAGLMFLCAVLFIPLSVRFRWANYADTESELRTGSRHLGSRFLVS